MKRRVAPTRRPQRAVIPAALQFAPLKTLAPSKTDSAVSLAKCAGATLALLASLVLTLPASATTFEQRVAASTDDAEELAGGGMALNRGDLQLTNATTHQTIGIRWSGVSIPRGATITAAYLQFTARRSETATTRLMLRGQAADDSPTFGSASLDLSRRALTGASANWAPVAWSAGQHGTNQRTPDLSAAIQEIVNRPGWASGHALAVIVTGTGHRTAWAWDGNAAAAPVLHVEYSASPSAATPQDKPPVAALTVTQLAAPPQTVIADASGSTDTDATPIASYRFNFGDGTRVTTLAPVATAQHTYRSAGSYSVSVNVTDTGGHSSSRLSRQIAVTPAPPVDNPPVARLSVAQVTSPSLTVRADASKSTDTDATPIASYTVDFGDGSTAVTLLAPTATAQHMYAAPGPYTVTLTATDTGGQTSAPAQASITVQPPAVDQPPVARLSLTQAASPALTVNADASASTDTDFDPIASYRFDFGDGSPLVTTQAPTAIAQHTYAAPGTYTVTLIAVDTGNQTSAAASATITLTASAGPQIAVYGGYYDTHHAVNPRPKPDPWQGSANTVFIGQPDNQPKDPPTGAWDTSALRVDNLTLAPLTGVVVTVDIGTMHRALWGTNTIPPGNHLVLTQTVFENFDVPDKYPAGCYGCDPNLCVTMRSAEIPVVHVTIGGTTTDYPDTGQTINTDGYDAAGCPYVGGPLPQTRYDESRNWVQLFPAAAPPAHAVPSALAKATPETFGRAAAYSVSLAPPSPNPARGELRLSFSTARHGPARVGVFDVNGRLVRPCIDSVLDPGSYSVAVDVGHIPAGIYFVRLWTPETTLHEKVAVMN